MKYSNSKSNKIGSKQNGYDSAYFFLIKADILYMNNIYREDKICNGY